MIKICYSKFKKAIEEYDSIIRIMTANQEEQCAYIAESRECWSGDAGDAYRTAHTEFLIHGTYRKYLETIKELRVLLEEILPGIQELQEMCADMPGTIGPACATGDYTDVLMLEESNLDSLLDKIDAILSTNESTYQKLNSIMDKCGNLCDFSVARQLNDDAYEQQNRLKDLKDLIIRYAFLIKQIDSELSIRYQGMIARISGIP